MIWAGAEPKNFFLWDSTAPLTPNLARRAVFFLHDIIRHRDGKTKFDTSGKSPARPHHRSNAREAGITAYEGPRYRFAHPGYACSIAMGYEVKTEELLLAPISGSWPLRRPNRCLQPAKLDNRDFRDYPVTGHAADMPKSTRMTRSGHGLAGQRSRCWVADAPAVEDLARRLFRLSGRPTRRRFLFQFSVVIQQFTTARKIRRMIGRLRIDEP
jgi:hypothetical protein